MSNDGQTHLGDIASVALPIAGFGLGLLNPQAGGQASLALRNLSLLQRREELNRLAQERLDLARVKFAQELAGRRALAQRTGLPVSFPLTALQDEFSRQQALTELPTGQELFAADPQTGLPALSDLGQLAEAQLGLQVPRAAVQERPQRRQARESFLRDLRVVPPPVQPRPPLREPAIEEEDLVPAGGRMLSVTPGGVPVQEVPTTPRERLNVPEQFRAAPQPRRAPLAPGLERPVNVPQVLQPPQPPPSFLQPPGPEDLVQPVAPEAFRPTTAQRKALGTLLEKQAGLERIPGSQVLSTLQTLAAAQDATLPPGLVKRLQGQVLTPNQRDVLLEQVPTQFYNRTAFGTATRVLQQAGSNRRAAAQLEVEAQRAEEAGRPQDATMLRSLQASLTKPGTFIQVGAQEAEGPVIRQAQQQLVGGRQALDIISQLRTAMQQGVVTGPIGAFNRLRNLVIGGIEDVESQFGGIEGDPSALFSPEVPRADFLSNALAYAIARSREGSGRLSVDDIERTKVQNDFLSPTRAFNERLTAAQNEIFTTMEVAATTASQGFRFKPLDEQQQDVTNLLGAASKSPLQGRDLRRALQQQAVEKLGLFPPTPLLDRWVKQVEARRGRQ